MPINPDVALANQAILMRMLKFYRIFDGNNMARSMAIAVAYHRRKR